MHLNSHIELGGIFTNFYTTFASYGLQTYFSRLSWLKWSFDPPRVLIHICIIFAQNAIFPTALFFSSDFTTFLIDFDDIMKMVSMQVDEKSKYRQTMLGGSQAWWVLSIWNIFMKSGEKSGEIAFKTWKNLFSSIFHHFFHHFSWFLHQTQKHFILHPHLSWFVPIFISHDSALILPPWSAIIWK